MGKKPKVHRWNRWEKEEEKLRKLREQLQKKQQTQTQQEPIRHATEEKPQEPPLRWEPRGWEPRKLNREVIAKLVAWHLREDPKLKKLAEEVAQKVILRVLPEITELVISQMVKVIHEAVLKGAKVEIRGLATWRTRNGRIKVKNHIKPKQPNQP
jgi:nucleoid DNA-binding protein